ncbi:MAG: acyl carrier protein [Candidatus Aenigmarchaeota archaeon]|nr:acyl carrier protein [Candidatus Aenigmarchaeota archaeon]
MTTTFERVRDIIVDQLGIDDDEVTLEAMFAYDLGADSLDAIEIVTALEYEFDIEIEDEDAEKLTRVSDAVEYVDRKLGEKARKRAAK